MDTDLDPTIDPTVACSDCQACCCQLPVLVLPGDAPPEHFLDEDDQGYLIMAKADDGWCVALDRERMCCSIYEQRPFVCREFAMGGGDCGQVRDDWRRIALSLQ
ncbi:YkgJ family cysteine cluster protein [Arenimonas terrae]|uniref:YkgJ family cysteine cluster protein n=1 Tax=Arenimonas terrae TaxID=2546226 RepID=A0A5C4RWU7_9GAMM|nr:YkgJ family cysteine cluster protein [Arenimonas terrae]TNJ35231.1 YkgJ family cysteine cluster protein [Arenimonas terrae]